MEGGEDGGTLQPMSRKGAPAAPVRGAAGELRESPRGEMKGPGTIASPCGHFLCLRLYTRVAVELAIG